MRVPLTSVPKGPLVGQHTLARTIPCNERTWRDEITGLRNAQHPVLQAWAFIRIRRVGKSRLTASAATLRSTERTSQYPAQYSDMWSHVGGAAGVRSFLRYCFLQLLEHHCCLNGFCLHQHLSQLFGHDASVRTHREGPVWPVFVLCKEVWRDLTPAGRSNPLSLRARDRSQVSTGRNTSPECRGVSTLSCSSSHKQQAATNTVNDMERDRKPVLRDHTTRCTTDNVPITTMEDMTRVLNDAGGVRSQRITR